MQLLHGMTAAGLKRSVVGDVALSSRFAQRALTRGRRVQRGVGQPITLETNRDSHRGAPPIRPDNRRRSETRRPSRSRCVDEPTGSNERVDESPGTCTHRGTKSETSSTPGVAVAIVVEVVQRAQRGANCRTSQDTVHKRVGFPKPDRPDICFTPPTEITAHIKDESLGIDGRELSPRRGSRNMDNGQIVTGR